MLQILSRLFAVALAAGAAFLPSAASAQTVRPDPFVFVFDRDEKGGTGEALSWWLLQSTIRPMGKSVSGVPLERLNKAVEDPASTWCYASAFTPASFVSPSRRVQAQIEETFRGHSSALFRSTAPFTGAAVQDAVVGNYETCDGAAGAFVLITDRAAPSPGIVYLKTFPEWQGLMWLRPEKDGLTISSCFECGHVERLYYDGARRRFYWMNEGD